VNPQHSFLDLLFPLASFWLEFPSLLDIPTAALWPCNSLECLSVIFLFHHISFFLFFAITDLSDPWSRGQRFQSYFPWLVFFSVLLYLVSAHPQLARSLGPPPLPLWASFSKLASARVSQADQLVASSIFFPSPMAGSLRDKVPPPHSLGMSWQAMVIRFLCF